MSTGWEGLGIPMGIVSRKKGGMVYFTHKYWKKSSPVPLLGLIYLGDCLIRLMLPNSRTTGRTAIQLPEDNIPPSHSNTCPESYKPWIFFQLIFKDGKGSRRRRGGERRGEREKNINVRETYWLVASRMSFNKGRGSNLQPRHVLDQELNLWPFSVQVGDLTIEHTNQGTNQVFLKCPL